MGQTLRFFAWACVVLSSLQLQAADLMSAVPADTWRTVNSTVETVTDADGTRYRWHPEPGQTAMLVLREDHPLFATIRDYEQLRLQYQIHGRISGMNLAAAGIVSGPRSYKLHDWLLAGLTTPRDAWQERVVSFSRPDWLPHDPADGPEAARYLRLEVLALEPGTWVEFRGMTLTPGLLTLKPDFEMPLTWPTLTRQPDGSALYTIRLELANSSGRPTDITATIASTHRAFDVAIQPEKGQPGADPLTTTLATVKSGQRAVFILTARLPAATEATLEALYAEPLTVRFTATVDPTAEVVWQGEVVKPLPADSRRQVLISDADLSALRRWMLDPTPTAKSLHVPQALSAANAFLEKELVRIPTGHPRVRNGWLGDWRPGDFMPEAVNSKTGERQVGTHTADATWTEYLGYTGSALDHLATAYLYTGEERYAQKAIELMGLYAQQYTEIPFYSTFDPAWNAGPPMLCASRMSSTSSYGTNWFGKGHCRLLSAIAESPSWTDESRQAVYHRFALPYALELMKFPGQVNNMTDITNRNVLLLGLAFRDAGLVRWALYSDPGLLRRISDLDADGFSSEGRPINYHRAAMEEYLPALVYLHHAKLGVELPLQRLEAALLMPYQRATLTGRVPSAGDMGRGGGVSATPLADVLSELLPDSDIHTLGTGHTIHAALRRHRAATAPAADAWKAQLESTPRLFDSAGFAILRSGETPETQIMVTLDYGSSRVHNHLDRNSISLSAFGLTYSQGPGSLYNAGRGGYTSHAQRDQLAPFSGHGSLGQNVIMVDQLDQLPAVGERLTWRVDSEVQVAAARVPGVRPGVTHDRYVALIRGVVIMLDHIHSDEEHVYDFLYHNLGTLSLGEGWTASAEAAVLGDAANYDNILNPRQLQGSGPLHLRWQVSDTAGLALWQLPVAGGRVYTGETGMCNPNDAIVPDAAPSLFHRVSGREATFVTVLEPFTDQPRIASIEGAANDGVLIHWVDGSKTTYTMREATP